MKDHMRMRVQVSELIEGSLYKGSISFNDLQFAYTLQFSQPLSVLDQLAREGQVDEVLRLTDLTVIDPEGKSLIPYGDVKTIFAEAAGKLAVDLYNNPERVAYRKRAGNDSAQYPLGVGIVSLSGVPRIPVLDKFLYKYENPQKTSVQADDSGKAQTVPE